MKKILFSLLAIVASMTTSAITLDEAFNRVLDVQGAAVSDIPSNDALEGAFETGKVVMFLGLPANSIDGIAGEITDAEVSEETIGGHKSTIYQTVDDAGKVTVFILTRTPMGPIVMFARGDKNVVATLLE